MECRSAGVMKERGWVSEDQSTHKKYHVDAWKGGRIKGEKGKKSSPVRGKRNWGVVAL